MEQPTPMDLQDLLRILQRRKWTILLPVLLIFSIITLIAYLLPAIYKSETLILIENQKIPVDYVQSTVTSEVEERLNVITQRLMSRTRLEGIIDKFKLYPEYQEKWTREEIIEKMRGDINLEIVSTEGVDKKSGRPVVFTVAFKLAYEGKDPDTVQAVTSELASLYIQENLRVRVDASAVTTQFVTDEMAKMEEKIQTLGKMISDYKQDHLNELPEQLQVNMANLDRYERYLETARRDAEHAKQNLVYLKGQIAGVDPDATLVSSYGQRVLSPREQLELDRTQLITLQSKLSENHPDVVELQQRIARLERETDSGDTRMIKVAMKEKEKELTGLMARYTDKHPDVTRVRSEIADLQVQLLNAGKASPVNYAPEPTNPAYINLMTQIESKRLEIQGLEQQQKEYMRLIDYYQQRLANTPTVEKALAAMQSEYDLARVNYQELSNKEIQAKISESLENRQQGERFTIVDPAPLPEKPYKPNRLAIMFIGLILGIGAGAGTGFLSEYQDQSFSSLEDLRSFSRVPVLAVISKVVTAREEIQKKKQRKIVFVSSVFAFIAIMVVVHLFFFKFDIFLIKLLRAAQKLPVS